MAQKVRVGAECGGGAFLTSAAAAAHVHVRKKKTEQKIFRDSASAARNFWCLVLQPKAGLHRNPKFVAVKISAIAVKKKPTTNHFSVHLVLFVKCKRDFFGILRGEREEEGEALRLALNCTTTVLIVKLRQSNFLALLNNSTALHPPSTQYGCWTRRAPN